MRIEYLVDKEFTSVSGGDAVTAATFPIDDSTIGGTTAVAMLSPVRLYVSLPFGAEFIVNRDGHALEGLINAGQV